MIVERAFTFINKYLASVCIFEICLQDKIVMQQDIFINYESFIEM